MKEFVVALLTIFYLPVAAVILIIAAVAIKKVRRWKLRKAFARFFGFEPPSPEQGLDEIDQAQRKVDGALKTYATHYAYAAIRENVTKAEAKKAKSGLEEDAHKLRAAVCTAEVQRAKKAFWDTHGLAKWARFAVRESFKDYLPNGLREQIERLPKGRKGPPREIPGPKPYLP